MRARAHLGISAGFGAIFRSVVVRAPPVFFFVAGLAAGGELCLGCSRSGSGALAGVAALRWTKRARQCENIVTFSVGRFGFRGNALAR